jgi:hypothetical protein
MVALRSEDQIALLYADMRKTDPQIIVRQCLLDTLSPLDDQGPGFEHRLQIQVLCFAVILQSIGVQVVKATSLWVPIYIHKHKGWTRGLIERTPTGSHALNQGRFARAQVAFQTNYITIFQKASQSHSNPARLLGIMADKF